MSRRALLLGFAAAAALTVVTSAAATIWPDENRPPDAVIDPGVSLVTDASCTRTVTPPDIDGGSNDPDVTEGLGDSLTLSVTAVTPTGEVQPVNLLAGSHRLRLTAVDATGASDADEATVQIYHGVGFSVTPSAINVQSRGQHLQGFLQSGSGCFDLGDVDRTSVTLTVLESGRVISAVQGSWDDVVGDGNDDGVPDLTVKFDRAAVQAASLDSTGQVVVPNPTYRVDAALTVAGRDGRPLRIRGVAHDVTVFKAGQAHVNEHDHGSLSE